MSLEIFQARDDWGQVQRVKNLTTSSAVVTYTAKTGRAADDFVIDRIIRVTTTSGNDMAVAIPNGVYYGQALTLLFEVEGNNETVSATTTQGDTPTNITGPGGYSILEWHGSTIGWSQIANSAT